MNPYQITPKSDVDPSAGEKSPASPPADDLARRQMRLVIRLIALSVVTTFAAVALFVFVGWDPTVTAVAFSLILGIGFTVAWKV